MSKGNMLLGHARGKVGSLVFSRANGQQITRARAEVVKNPQTDAQMVQRILLNTVAQAYSKMSAIVDHSFEGIPAGQKSMSYFMKKNLDSLRQVLAEQKGDLSNEPSVSPINSNILAVNTYEISKGSLPIVEPSIVTGSGIQTGVTTNTYAAVINKFGLQRGDQLTIVMIEENNQNLLSFRYARIILDPRNADGSEAPLSTAFFTGNAVTLPNPKNETNGIGFALEEGEVTFTPVDYCVAGAMIVSRQKEDGTWLRSNSHLIDGEEGTMIQFSVQDALDDFKSGSIDIINPRYLNNAGRGNVAAAQEVPQFTIGANAGFGVSSVEGAGSYNRGANVTLRATLQSGKTFEGWYSNASGTGTPVSTANPYTFKATQDVTLYAFCENDEPNGD